MTGIKLDIGLPPDETVAYFRAKGSYPISERWWMVWQEEHVRAFTVARVTDRTVLEQVRRSLDVALSEGRSFAQWKTEVLPDLRAAVLNGTAPEHILTDARLRVIYSTNLRMARAAGQWTRIERAKARAPYLMYHAILDGRTRPSHKRWDGTVLDVDDPWWNTHYPPCGWNCRCNVIQLSQRDLDEQDLRVGQSPKDGPDVEYERPDGAIEQVPAGIDPGFAYNPGKEHMRGLAVRNIDGPISEPAFPDRPFPPLPEPRPVPRDVLLPRDTPDERAIGAFLDVLSGTERGGAIVALDVLGEPVILSDDFFNRRSAVGSTGGESKLDGGRIEAMRLLARTIKDPDEVWYVWEEVDRRDGRREGRITRRYVARFLVEGKVRAMVVAVEIGPEGWRGVTAFPPKQAAYPEREQVRGGVLAYRRK